MALDSLRRAIVEGSLQPGQKLREVSLAAELGVSRPTLREALLTLVHEGLCVQTHLRGFSVSTLDDAAIRDLARTRLVLDRMAVHEIWARSDGVTDAEVAWSLYAPVAEDSDGLRRHIAHLEFHRALWWASGNTMLRRLWPVTEALATLALAQDQAVRRDSRRAHDVHEAIMKAVIARDPDLLELALARHTQDSAEDLISLRAE